MSTKELIKKTALGLFNRHGLVNTTLRQVADALGKSYGNITYHFGTKDDLIEELYIDMTKELKEATVQANFTDASLFTLPMLTYDLSIKYLFFYVDYVELKRSYPLFMKKVDRDHASRAALLKHYLVNLQRKGILQSELDNETLDFIMDVSGVIRTFYFQKYYSARTRKDDYVSYVNRLIIPYLTTKGYELYLASS